MNALLSYKIISKAAVELQFLVIVQNSACPFGHKLLTNAFIKAACV
jgi:hypothetical protein